MRSELLSWHYGLLAACRVQSPALLKQVCGVEKQKIFLTFASFKPAGAKMSLNNLLSVSPSPAHLKGISSVSRTGNRGVFPSHHVDLAFHSYSFAATECSHFAAPMSTTHRMQSPACISWKASLILSRGCRWVMNSSTFNRPSCQSLTSPGS
jgi:hypothetical protein